MKSQISSQSMLILFNESRGVRNPGVPQPCVPRDKILHGELRGLGDGHRRVHAIPRHPAVRRCTGPGVGELAVEQRAQRGRIRPLQPPRRRDGAVQVALHHPHPCELPPRAAQVHRRAAEVRRAGDPALLEGDAGVLVPVVPALSRDGVPLARDGLPGLDAAVLEDHGGVAEDEVHRAGDVVLGVELPVRLRVERVLVRLDIALVQHRAVAGDHERHRLALPWPGAVDDAQALADEARAQHNCNTKLTIGTRTARVHLVHEQRLQGPTLRTDGGGVVGGVAVAGALAPVEDRLPLAVAHQHHVRVRDSHGLHVPSGLHVEHHPPASSCSVATARRPRARRRDVGDRIVDTSVRPAAVQRHHGVRRDVGHRGLQEPPVVFGQPGRERDTFRCRRRRGGRRGPLPALHPADVQRQCGADELGERADLLAHGVAPRGGWNGGEALVARVLVRHRGAQPRPRPFCIRRGSRERVAQLVEGDVKQLDAVAHARRRLGRGGRGEVARQRVRRRGPGDRELHGRRERVPGRPRLRRRQSRLAGARVRRRLANQHDVLSRWRRGRRGGDPRDGAHSARRRCLVLSFCCGRNTCCRCES
jgi:hypothetical protein